jgi:hypothetical protein
MASEGKTKKINFPKNQELNFSWFLEVNALAEERKKGQFTIRQRKKKREIIEESHNQVILPPDVGEEDKKALEQTGDDATSGW